MLNSSPLQLQRGMPVTGRDDWIKEFLAADKQINRRARWATKGRADHSEAKASVSLRDGRAPIRGKFTILAHRTLEPPKYGFSLHFGGTRILGLDVNPKRSHRNILTGQSITKTHWQRYPLMEAEFDDREFSFRGWVEQFLSEANIQSKYRIGSPQRGQQLELEFLPWKR